MSTTGPDGPAPDARETFDAFSPRTKPSAATAPSAWEPFPTSAPLPSGAPEPAGPRRWRGALRAVAMLVAAVALVAVTVGVQWWDRTKWVAERYPAEVVKDVPAGGTATLGGIVWKATVSVMPATAGQIAGTTSLEATVEVTPLSEQDADQYHSPRFSVRDRAGHTWVARTAGTLTSLDLEPGKPSRITVVAAVPAGLADTAELVLDYSPTETLRFVR
ncbi:hypothetical protein [Sphaerisporangium fuscum]|uniref:hypothetical protein n=1 Tax=Sphaerisporangium fuscum TaxID=2835868 RepID=UPI001BDC3DFB|nr:hypothetical protein [Sphaerisporangium fuscum]